MPNGPNKCVQLFHLRAHPEKNLTVQSYPSLKIDNYYTCTAYRPCLKPECNFIHENTEVLITTVAVLFKNTQVIRKTSQRTEKSCPCQESHYYSSVIQPVA